MFDKIYRVKKVPNNERADRIREDIVAGILPNWKIASKHGVTPSNVSIHRRRILNGRPNPAGGVKGATSKVFWTIDGDSAIYTNSSGCKVYIDVDLYPKFSAGYIRVAMGVCGYKAAHYKPEKNAKSISISRLIMRPTKGFVVDHINGNSLDNRRTNLRICTWAENSQNRKSNQNKMTSKYKGVSLYRGKWLSRIRIDGEDCKIGRFETEIEAACAYDNFARRFHGAFARLNFPNENEQPAVHLGEES